MVFRRNSMGFPRVTLKLFNLPPPRGPVSRRNSEIHQPLDFSDVVHRVAHRLRYLPTGFSREMKPLNLSPIDGGVASFPETKFRASSPNHIRAGIPELKRDGFIVEPLAKKLRDPRVVAFARRLTAQPRATLSRNLL